MLLFPAAAYSAVGQILNDIFFINPAELSLIDHAKWIAGSIFVSSKFIFDGTVSTTSGHDVSQTYGTLPFFLGAYRVNDRLVLGVNVTPSTYGSIDWPLQSILGEITTTTNVLFYRAGIQSSYQVTPQLALGVGFNMEDNKELELDFYIPHQGHQLNQVSAWGYTIDASLNYKITHKCSFSFGGYSRFKKIGSGFSTLNSLTSNNFTLNVAEAPVLFAGLKEQLTDLWSVGGKIYWSGWSMQKNLYFTNSATGSFIIPTDWHNVWSYFGESSFAVSDKLTFLGSAMYETSAAPQFTNSPGFPIAPTLFGSFGARYKLKNDLSAQVIYGYGVFVPQAKINKSGIVGTIAANVQLAALEFSYKK